MRNGEEIDRLALVFNGETRALSLWILHVWRVSWHLWRGWDGSSRPARSWRRRSKHTNDRERGFVIACCCDELGMYACSGAIDGGGRRSMLGGSWAHQSAVAAEEKTSRQKYATSEGKRQPEAASVRTACVLKTGRNSTRLDRAKRIRPDKDF